MKSDTCNHANEAVSFVITPLYSYFYPFLFYVPDEGCIPILFPFLGGIHHGVDFLAQFPSEFGQWVGDVVIIVSHEFLLIQYDKDIPVTILPGGTSGLRAEKYRLPASRQVFRQAFTDSRQYIFCSFCMLMKSMVMQRYSKIFIEPNINVTFCIVREKYL